MSDFFNTGLYKIFEPKYKDIVGKPFITVSAKGISNGLSNIPNDGADFGPDTMLNATSPSQTGSPYTQTNGRQEAVNYASTFNPILTVRLLDGIHSASATTYLPAGIKILGNGFNTIISPNDTSLIVFKNYQNEGFQEISNMAFNGLSYRGIDMSNFTSTNNGVNIYVHDIRFNTEYTDCQIDMDNTGQSLVENIWNTGSGTTSTYSLRWNVNGEAIRINNFYDGSTNGMLLVADSIRMSQCQVNRINFNLALQPIYDFSYIQGTLNGYGIANPTFSFIANVSSSVAIQNFNLEDIEWNQGSLSSLFDLSQMLGTLYFINMSFNNVVFLYGDTSIPVSWTNALPSGASIGYKGYIPFKISLKNVAFDTWGTFKAPTGAPAYQIPPFTQNTNYSDNLPNKVLPYGTPSVPASGTAQSNPNPMPVKIYLYGGAVTEIQITTLSNNGVPVTVFSNSTGVALSGQVFELDTNDSITITYTTAPTWVWMPSD